MSNVIDGARLHQIVAEYESLDEERQTAQRLQKELLDDAEWEGMDKKILRRMIKQLRDRALMEAEAAALQAYLDAYLSWDATPLGASASASEGGTIN